MKETLQGSLEIKCLDGLYTVQDTPHMCPVQTGQEKVSTNVVKPFVLTSIIHNKLKYGVLTSFLYVR